MKLKNKTGSNLKDYLLNGTIAPTGKEKVQLNFLGNNAIEISFNTSLDTYTNGYVFLYDKKSTSCIAIQEILDIKKNKLVFKFSSDFIKTLNALQAFSYGRLCLILEQETRYACFYLEYENFDEDNYIENSSFIGCAEQNENDKRLAVYFSKAGLLSVKFISEELYCRLFYDFKITDVKLEADTLIAVVSEPAILNNKQLKYQLISKTRHEESESLELQYKKNDITNQTTLQVDLSTISVQDIDAYSIKAYVNDIDITISVADDVVLNESTSAIHTLNSNNIQYTLCITQTDTSSELQIQFAEHIYPYMISVIMAVYNTELFLREALDSLLVQKTEELNQYLIGHDAKNYTKRIYQNICQVIMVDDGATDNSGVICDEYADKYSNFFVIHKENGGVSSARNAGINLAEGKYLNFMDSDDKFSENVFVECFPYFEEHYDETNIITFPIRFFDASTGDHWLNNKFEKGNRIINLLSEHDKSLLFVNASFFKTESIKNKFCFEESLVTGEDIRFIYSNFFTNGPKFGVIQNCTYWYRRRSVGEPSAIQESNLTRNYYYEYLTDCLEWLIDKSVQIYGFTPHYIQYLVAQQLQWRFVGDCDAEIAKSVLNQQEFSEYKQHICDILKRIDQNIILEQRRLFTEHRKCVLELRNNCKAEKVFDGTDILYYMDGKQLSTASSFVRLEFLKIKKNQIYIEGYFRTFEENSEFLIKLNDIPVEIQFTNQERSSYALGELIYKGVSFTANIVLDDTTPQYVLGFYERIDGHEIHKSRVMYHKRMPLTKTYFKSYYAKDGWGIRLAQGYFKIDNLMYSDAPQIYNRYEQEFVAQVMKSASEEKKNLYKTALKLREDVLTAKAYIQQYSSKKIWLISDRVNVAGDNGEAFFRYMVEKNDPDIEVYFVINETCADYRRLSKIGNVVAQNSYKHKYLLLLAEYVISSQAEEYVYNPFEQDGTDDLFKDLISMPKFVFLQHGVIKDDLSEWLNRYNKDIDGFITAAKPEYDSILEYDYFYTPKEVWLTGLPRHDRLYHDEKKYITIMPTWRSYLVKDSDEMAEKVVKDNFQLSDFFCFYNRLLNNKRLLDVADKYGYTICFMPHPHLMNGISLFNRDPRVKFFAREKAYHEMFAESDLIMTDYSSSIMDFVYLRKPIVYCHFDSEEFFSGKHTYEKGYFEYERDGFGEVTYDLDSVVDQMIEYMEHGCQLKSKYKERIDKFFAFNDKNNCERVYNKLKGCD